ncbi:MAG: S1 family peptidase [Gemmatimonadota bacterium]|nr:S1 family peptidase [Gemmatimonadota bacterium]
MAGPAQTLRPRPPRHTAWHEKAWPHVLSVSGAVFSDIDEGTNRLRFGGVDAAAVQRVAGVLGQLGIPSDASIVEQTAPIERMHTLRDRVRPVHGGYQINFLDAAGVRTVSFLCTLGFNVVKNGVSSFITNSHCTNHQGGTETPTDYYQPLMDPDGDRLVNPENFIGVEVEDPHYDAVSCAVEMGLPGTVCRYSDAARAEYRVNGAFELGRIARTTQGYQDAPRGPDGVRIPVLDVDPAKPSFTIKSEQQRSVLGEQANKVGRTTGWTFGPVTQTCLNSIVLGTAPPIVQRCQDRVRADVDGGDSGSPVFRQRGGGGNVALMGILWGGSVSGTVTFVFSPMANIHRELGDFQTH